MGFQLYKYLLNMLWTMGYIGCIKSLDTLGNPDSHPLQYRKVMQKFLSLNA